MTLGSNAAAKAEESRKRVHVAIGAYIAKHGPDVAIGDLRSFVRDTTSLDYAASTLARMLVGRGYVKEGVRKIDTCPGKATFYVPGDPRRMPGTAAAAVLEGSK